MSLGTKLIRSGRVQRALVELVKQEVSYKDVADKYYKEGHENTAYHFQGKAEGIRFAIEVLKAAIE